MRVAHPFPSDTPPLPQEGSPAPLGALSLFSWGGNDTSYHAARSLHRIFIKCCRSCNEENEDPSSSSVTIKEANDASREEDPSADKRKDEDPGSPPRSLRPGRQITKKTKRTRILLPQLSSQGKQEEGGSVFLDRHNEGGVRQTRTRGSLHPMKRRVYAASWEGLHEVPPRWGRHDRRSREYYNGWQTAVIPGSNPDGNVGCVIRGNMQDRTRGALFLVYNFK